MFFFPFFWAAPAEAAAAAAASGTPCCSAFGRAESQSMRAHKGGIEDSESQLFPEATGNKEAETAQRETEARGWQHVSFAAKRWKD